jgi:hypothetical protein
VQSCTSGQNGQRCGIIPGVSCSVPVPVKPFKRPLQYG